MIINVQMVNSRNTNKILLRSAQEQGNMGGSGSHNQEIRNERQPNLDPPVNVNIDAASVSGII